MEAPPHPIRRHHRQSEAISRHQPSSRGVPSGGASPPNSLLHRPAHGRRVTSDGIRATRCQGAREVGHTRLEGRLRRLAVVFGGRAADGGNQRSLVRPSEAIRGDQRQSEVISRSSEAIRGDHRSLVGHQRQSPDGEPRRGAPRCLLIDHGRPRRCRCRAACRPDRIDVGGGHRHRRN